LAVKIRLVRLGKIRTPHYRIVVADSRKARNGLKIEEIGRYSPASDPSLIQVDSDRAQHWLKQGAQPTEAVEAAVKSAMNEPKDGATTMKKRAAEKLAAKTTPAEETPAAEPVAVSEVVEAPVAEAAVAEVAAETPAETSAE